MPNDRSILGLVIESQTVGQQEIDKLTASFNKFADSVSKQSQKIAKDSDTAAKSFAQFKQAATDPLAAASNAAESFVLKFGKVGAVIGGVAVAAGVGAIAIQNLVEEQGKLAEQSSNMADRLGLGVGQTQQLSAMARIAGVDIGFLENASARLAASLEDQTGKGAKAQKVLSDLGVATRTQSGDQRELGQVSLDVIKALAGIDDATRRTAAGAVLFGRGFNEITPLVRNFRQLESAVQSAGIGLDENGTKKLAEFDDQIDIVNIKWDELKRSLAAKIAPIEIEILTTLGGALDKNNTSPNLIETLVRTAIDSAKQHVLGDFGGVSRDINQFLVPPQIPSAPTPGVPNPINEDLERGRALTAQFQRRFGINEDDLQKKLATLKQQHADLEGDLVSNDIGGKAKDAKAVLLSQNEKEIAQTQAQIKLLQQRKQLEEDIAKLREGAASSDIAKKLGIDLDHATPSQSRLVDLLGSRGITPAQSDQVQALLAPKILEEQQKRVNALGQNLDVSKVAAEEQRIQQAAAASIQRIQSSRAFGSDQNDTQDIDIANRVADVRTQAAQRVFDLERERIELETAFLPQAERDLQTQISLTKARGDLDKETGEAELERQQKLLAIQNERNERQKQAERDISVANISSREQQAQQAGDRQIQLLQLTAKPGSEVSTARAAANVRVQTAQQVYDFEKQISDTQIAAMKVEDQATAREIANIKLKGDLDKAQQDAGLEYWGKVLDLQQQQIQQGRDAAGKVFDAVTASGKDGLNALAISFGKTIERQIFVNLTSSAFELSRKTLSKAIPGQVDPNGNLTGLGKILQGTPFGVDPLKLATTLNTTSTNLNTTALGKLTAVISGGSTNGPGSSPVQLIDRPGLRTPGFAPDGLKDEDKAPGEPILKILDDNAETQKQGTDILKKLSDKVLTIGSTAAVAAAGAAQSVAGFGQGGAKGIAAGTAGVASAVGSIAGPLAKLIPSLTSSLSFLGPIASVAGVGLSLISGFLPNAKQAFDQAQDAALAKNKYTDPTSTSKDFDLKTGGTTVVDTARGLPQIVVNISTVDARGVKDLFDTHASTMADVIGKATLAGMSPLMTQAARQAVIGPEA